MVDLDEEFVRMEGLLARRERMALGVTCTEMIELITRLRQAEKDAARWRKLADSPDSSLTLRIHNSRCDQRDKVIDEAMK